MAVVFATGSFCRRRRKSTILFFAFDFLAAVHFAIKSRCAALIAAGIAAIDVELDEAVVAVSAVVLSAAVGMVEKERCGDIVDS